MKYVYQALLKREINTPYLLQESSFNTLNSSILFLTHSQTHLHQHITRLHAELSM